MCMCAGFVLINAKLRHARHEPLPKDDMHATNCGSWLKGNQRTVFSDDTRKRTVEPLGSDTAKHTEDHWGAYELYITKQTVGSFKLDIAMTLWNRNG